MGPSDRGSRDNVPAARALRKVSTPSEALLWERLRARRFHGLKVRRQHPIGKFVLDFYCEDLQLAIEADGNAHDDPAVRANDREREHILEEQGTWFVRVDADATESDIHRVLAEIEHACRFTQAVFSPSPTPGRRGAGVEGIPANFVIPPLTPAHLHAF